MEGGGLTEGSQRRQSSTVNLDQKEQDDHLQEPWKGKIEGHFIVHKKNPLDKGPS